MKKHQRYDSLIQWYTQCYPSTFDADWLWRKAQIAQESAFDSDAENKRSHAKGLSQFMDATWKEWWDGTPGIQDLPINPLHINQFDPEDVIKAQCAYMSWIEKWVGAKFLVYADPVLRDRHVLQHALYSYNWGIGNWLKWYRVGGKIALLPEETKDYYDRILKLYIEGYDETWK